MRLLGVLDADLGRKRHQGAVYLINGGILCRVFWADAKGRAEQTEHRALGEQLAQDSGPPCTQGRPYGELFGAGSCACQKEIGHIGARDQEH